ncbi:hypothetical protein O7623_15860 [Solwaraspora sp. WMMD791]|uniref:hypothetical protein n=1 Tax=Solwaraspora sp. WMMD791 TaxID=3016086 RepID=UPI00249BDA1F|nr:hypothetical protein [Solwaraspora sp. WMMD791]WFE24909.1 hypothetical protein O7623_15860 [Solwaraspora sp. WMMD791]
MIIEMMGDWWLRCRDRFSSRSAASQRLEALRREQTAVRRRRLDGNRGHHWSTEATMLVPTTRPLLTYAQQLGYRLPRGVV